jgi:apolipoprotein D and lipocalin family protein
MKMFDLRHAGLAIPALLLLLATVVAVGGCAAQPPLPAVPQVDLPRFMGPWYVIANIPTFIEKDAHNAIESYQLAADGSIATTFTFNAGSDTGSPKAYHPNGRVVPGTGNAVWGMQFVWPIRAEYRIFYLDSDYTRVIIARTARDYLWIMARTPQIPEEELQRLIGLAVAAGYDAAKVQRVPQAAPRKPTDTAGPAK